MHNAIKIGTQKHQGAIKVFSVNTTKVGETHMKEQLIQEFVVATINSKLVEYEEKEIEDYPLFDAVVQASRLGILVDVDVIVNKGEVEPETIGDEDSDYLIQATFADGDTKYWHAGDLFCFALEDYIYGAELFRGFIHSLLSQNLLDKLSGKEIAA